MTLVTSNPTTALVDRYVALWNEPDDEVRRHAVAALWAEDGRHVLDAPDELRAAAAAIGFARLELEASGHDELAFRAATAYREFVAPGAHVFRSTGDAARLGDVVKFTWHMVQATTGAVVAVGTELLHLDASGRIVLDQQFIQR